MKKISSEIRMKSNDLLEEAYNAKSKASAIKYLKESLKLDPENLDAENYLLTLTSKNAVEMLYEKRKLAEKGLEIMKSDSTYPDDIGSFWGIIETRPYIRVLRGVLDCELECGMFSSAIKTAEEVIKLNESDNTGARYTLMALYAEQFMEEEAEKLLAKYERDEYLGAGLGLPLSVLYFKLDKLDKSKAVLQRLLNFNPDTKKFFKCIVSGDIDEEFSNMSSLGYRGNTIQEYLTYFAENQFLYLNMGQYFNWANEELKKMKKMKK